MKATAKYVINVEIKGEDEEDVLFDCRLFANHLHRMLDTYAQIGDIHINRYWMGDGDEPKNETHGMTGNSLDYEVGYRAAIIECLKMITPKDQLWDRLAQMQKKSAARTDSTIQITEGAEE